MWISISRLVNHQRREIGIDLSLGTDDKKILLYYLSYGFLIGVLGGIFSIIFGYYVGKGMGSLTEELLNLPGWETNIRMDFALQAWTISLTVSLLSAFWPAWKSSRLLPITALRQDPSLVRVKRHKSMKIIFRDLQWNEQSFDLDGDLSELLQHEYDHLEGILAFSRAIDNHSFALRSALPE